MDEGNFLKQSNSNMERDVYLGKLSLVEYHEKKIQLKMSERSGLDDGTSCTKGLLDLIRHAIEMKKNLNSFFLCSNADHYASTYGDKKWGCGYRNIQIVLSSLLNYSEYRNIIHLEPDQMFSIPKIQKLIENAWNQGFDPQGCQQLGGKLVNTRTWIGATEVATLLSSLNIRCQIIDFHRATGPKGTHPELLDWCMEYFRDESPYRCKPPLYLQHQGHSRVIIGLEQLKSAISLLIFDPSHSKSQFSKFQSLSSDVALRAIHKPLSAFKSRQYQIVVVEGIMDSDLEFERSKMITSRRIPYD